jgi:hypothetical protein
MYVRLRAWVHNLHGLVCWPEEQMGQPRVAACSNLHIVLTYLQWENGPVECLGRFRGLVLGGIKFRRSEQKAPIISHMSFRFSNWLNTFSPRTLWITQEAEKTDNATWAWLFFPFLLIHFCLCCPHSEGEETGAGYGVGRVKVTSIVDKTDLERRVSKLNTCHTL